MGRTWLRGDRQLHMQVPGPRVSSSAPPTTCHQGTRSREAAAQGGAWARAPGAPLTPGNRLSARVKGCVCLRGSGSGRPGSGRPGSGWAGPSVYGEAGSGSERCCQKTGKLNKHEPPGCRDLRASAALRAAGGRRERCLSRAGLQCCWVGRARPPGSPARVGGGRGEGLGAAPEEELRWGRPD